MKIKIKYLSFCTLAMSQVGLRLYCSKINSLGSVRCFLMFLKEVYYASKMQQKLNESANCLFVEKVKFLLDRNMCVGAVPLWELELRRKMLGECLQ